MSIGQKLNEGPPNPEFRGAGRSWVSYFISAMEDRRR